MKVVFIHGANATKTSWNWLGSQIEDHIRLEWSMVTDPETNLQEMEAQLPNEPCMVVGHSMGGLYAWHLADRNPDKIVKGLSFGTPWGGSIQASIWKIFNVNIPWLKMLSRIEPWTTQPRMLETPVPWTNVITSRGFDLFGVGANDGVVTVTSQQELHGSCERLELNYGHNEVLQSPELFDIIRQRAR